VNLDFGQIGYQILKNFEKVVFYALGLIWFFMCLTLFIQSGTGKDRSIVEIELPHVAPADITEGQKEWQEDLEKIRDPGKFSVYKTYTGLRRTDIFSKYENEGPVEHIVKRTTGGISFYCSKIIIDPFPIKYMGVFDVGGKLTAQINWAKETYFKSEQEKIKNYTVTRITAESVEVEDISGKKMVLPYKEETYDTEFRAVMVVKYVLGDKEELNEYTVLTGDKVGPEEYSLEIVMVNREDVIFKVKYTLKDEDEGITKEEEVALNLKENKVINLTVKKEDES